LKKARILFILLLLAASKTAFSQAITMHAVLSLSRVDIDSANRYLRSNKWKVLKPAKVDPQEIHDPHSKYAHFNNCFFLLADYKKKFNTDPENPSEGLFRDVYTKQKDSVFLYYFNVDHHRYPAGLLYKTNRKKLAKITTYLKHNKYTQTFTRDSLVIYEVKPSIENVTLDKSSSTSIEYYIDRCWKYAGQRKKAN
jgi:hypothetical protein